MKLAVLGQILFVLVAAAFVHAFVVMARDGETRRACSAVCALSPNYAAENRRAPDFELPNLRGQRVRLSQYRGKAVILNFWSKTCRPCLEEMPSIATLAHSLAGRDDVAVVTITIDESADDALATLESILGKDIPFEVLIDPESQVVAGKFGTKLYPETWFIDADGVVRARVDGARDWSSSQAVALVDSFRSSPSCQVEFRGGRAEGRDAAACSDGFE